MLSISLHIHAEISLSVAPFVWHRLINKSTCTYIYMLSISLPIHAEISISVAPLVLHRLTNLLVLTYTC